MDPFETNIPPDDVTTMDTAPPRTPSPESIDSCKQPEVDPEPRMNIASLCNPNNEDDNLRGHHTSEFFSNDLEDFEKRTFAAECNSKWTFITLIA